MHTVQTHIFWVNCVHTTTNQRSGGQWPEPLGVRGRQNEETPPRHWEGVVTAPVIVASWGQERKPGWSPGAALSLRFLQAASLLGAAARPGPREHLAEEGGRVPATLILPLEFGPGSRGGTAWSGWLQEGRGTFGLLHSLFPCSLSAYVSICSTPAPEGGHHQLAEQAARTN